MNKIATIAEGRHEVRTYRDSAWNQYIIKAYRDGILKQLYHTDDVQDATHTAKAILDSRWSWK